jgi:hypothetical protein
MGAGAGGGGCGGGGRRRLLTLAVVCGLLLCNLLQWRAYRHTWADRWAEREALQAQLGELRLELARQRRRSRAPVVAVAGAAAATAAPNSHNNAAAAAPRTQSAQALVTPPPPPQPRRIVAIGDIHGDLEAWQRALRLGGLVCGPAPPRWCANTTTLVQIGDLVNKREPRDMAVLRYTERLAAEAAAAGGRLVVVLGDHDLHNLPALLQQQEEGTTGSSSNGGGRLPSWLTLVLPLEGTLFVHGSLVPALLAQRSSLAKKMGGDDGGGDMNRGGGGTGQQLQLLAGMNQALAAWYSSGPSLTRPGAAACPPPPTVRHSVAQRCVCGAARGLCAAAAAAAAAAVWLWLR